MSNNIQPITWKQIGIIIMMLTFFFAGFGYINTKADKLVVNKQIENIEKRSEKRISNVQVELKEDIKRIEKKMDKVYDLLLKMDNKN